MENLVKQKRSPIQWTKEIGFILIHFSPVLIFFTGATLFDWIICITLYFVRMFFVTGGYHRYFSHKTYKTSRWFQFFLAFMAQTSLQKGALWWAANHRIHHKHSDTPEDPHSANIYGLFYSHLGWIMGPDYKETRYDLIKDLTKFPELVWLNKYYIVPPFLLMMGVWISGSFVNGTGFESMFNEGLSSLVVGFFTSTMLLYHGTFSINSLMHKIGKPRYRTGDLSKNSLSLALLTLGEGWHNNHHFFQSSARNGFFWWEIDITYYVLKALSWLGIVWDLRPVPYHIKYAHKQAA